MLNSPTCNRAGIIKQIKVPASPPENYFYAVSSQTPPGTKGNQERDFARPIFRRTEVAYLLNRKEMEYREYLRTEDWREKKRKKLKRNRRCGICGDPQIDIHHLNYRNLFDVEQSDLRKMCRRCHFLAHDLLKAGKLVFKSASHHSRWASIKIAVKKELRIAGKNMFH